MIFKTFIFSLVPGAINTGASAKFDFQGKESCSGALPPGTSETSPCILTSPASSPLPAAVFLKTLKPNHNCHHDNNKAGKQVITVLAPVIFPP